MASVAPKEVIISRTINAPREIVFEAFTNAEHVAKWFGPRIFTATAESDPRIGGEYRFTMYGNAGVPPEYSGPFPMKGKYLEIIRPERIVHSADLSEHSDDWKNILRSNIANYNGQDFLHMVMTITFEEIEPNKTKVTIKDKFDSDEVRDAYLKMGMKEGWAESFDKLDELLKK